jgi:AP-2 complex subunit alpha
MLTLLHAGEFGYLIAEQPGMGGEAQFSVLHKHFPNVSHRIKALLLSSYAKLNNLYPEVRPLAQPVLEKYAPSTELELQQRAVEYRALLTQGDDIMDAVLQGEGPCAVLAYVWVYVVL